jgi:hypothetical protein
MTLKSLIYWLEGFEDCDLDLSDVLHICRDLQKGGDGFSIFRESCLSDPSYAKLKALLAPRPMLKAITPIDQ